jgi:ATP-binding cassette, subfamily B, bacterial HlyB/CyaB
LKGKVTMMFITHALPKGLQTDAIYLIGPQGAQRVALAPHSPRHSREGGNPAT